MAMKTATEEKLIDVLQFISKERNIPFEMLHRSARSGAADGVQAAFRQRSERDRDRRPADRRIPRVSPPHGRRRQSTDPKLEISAKEAGPAVSARRLLRRRGHAERFRPHRRADRQASHRAAHPRSRARHGLQQVRRKLNDIVTGTVQRLRTAQHVRAARRAATKRCCPLSEQVPRENFRINDFIRAYVLDVRKSPKGPRSILSRAAEGLVQRLLEFEVPEIEDGIVEIMAIAREPGSRSKVAVRSNRAEVDPIGACLGPKSSRIANVSDESARREDRRHSLGSPIRQRSS